MEHEVELVIEYRGLEVCYVLHCRYIKNWMEKVCPSTQRSYQ